MERSSEISILSAAPNEGGGGMTNAEAYGSVASKPLWPGGPIPLSSRAQHTVVLGMHLPMKLVGRGGLLGILSPVTY